MGRIDKNNADYFPHLTTMRNHRKVKMIRNRFGAVLGYAFWSMLLEYLTEQDGNEFEWSDNEIEMFAAELGIDQGKAKELFEYCIQKELLFVRDGFIHSQSLDIYLAPVYAKRQYNKVRASEARQRKNSAKESPTTTPEPKQDPKAPEVKPQPQTPQNNTPAPDSTKAPETAPEEVIEVEVIEDGEQKPETPVILFPKGGKKKPGPPKIQFAENVKMTEAEYCILVSDHGEGATRRMIEILDNYKGSKGVTYKSDYRAILSWVIDRYNKEQNNGNNVKSLADKAKTADSLINSMFSK